MRALRFQSRLQHGRSVSPESKNTAQHELPVPGWTCLDERDAVAKGSYPLGFVAQRLAEGGVTDIQSASWNDTGPHHTE